VSSNQALLELLQLIMGKPAAPAAAAATTTPAAEDLAPPPESSFLDRLLARAVRAVDKPVDTTPNGMIASAGIRG
jgi:hypothetical protein